MTTFDIGYYISAWRRRAELEKKREKMLAEKAFDTARFLTKVLVDRYGAKKVYLFGSLALYLKGLKSFKISSDIDLAVQPIPKEKYFYILAEMNRMSDFEVDIIDLEDCPKILRDSILKNGILLYEE